jgi:glucose/arabinose dehydrogenase
MMHPARRRLARVTVLLVVMAVWFATMTDVARARIVARRVVRGLQQAVAFTFDDRGRIWFVQKSVGDIRVVDPDSGHQWRFFRVHDVAAEAEQGLVGIALHPGFPQEPFVYVFATRIVDDELVDQILRVENVDGRGRHPRVIYSSAASSAHIHSSGRILFGPDGMLYAAVGDAGVSSNAQSVSSTRGKILRMTPNGHVPADNPSGSLVWASGIRNSFGFAFDPVSLKPWETENGPECNDEVNRLRAGGNFGWGPSETCSGTAPGNTNQDGPNPIQPQLWYTPTIAPTGLAFCDGCRLGPHSEGAFFFGSYNTGDIRRVALTADRLSVASESVVANAADIALSMEAGPDGRIYFSSYIAIFKLVKVKGRAMDLRPVRCATRCDAR